MFSFFCALFSKCINIFFFAFNFLKHPLPITNRWVLWIPFRNGKKAFSMCTLIFYYVFDRIHLISDYMTNLVVTTRLNEHVQMHSFVSVAFRSSIDFWVNELNARHNSKCIKEISHWNRSVYSIVCLNRAAKHLQNKRKPSMCWAFFSLLFVFMWLVVSSRYLVTLDALLKMCENCVWNLTMKNQHHRSVCFLQRIVERIKLWFFFSFCCFDIR